MADERSAADPKPAEKMPTAPNRSGRRVFTAVFLMLSIGIAAALLFANDMQNLRRLFQRFDLEWPPRWLARVETPAEIAPPTPATPPVVKLPERVFSPAPADSLAGFLREMRQAGPDFCDALGDAGLANTGWKASPVDPDAYECFSETYYGPAPEDDAAPRASFFFIAKGSADGDIASIRMKLVAPAGEPGEKAHAALLKGLELLIARTGWSDLAALRESVREFEDYSAQYFGQSFSFTREFTSPDRFNLIILPADGDPAVRRTRDYFDPDRWLPVPSIGGAPPTPFHFPLNRRGT